MPGAVLGKEDTAAQIKILLLRAHSLVGVGGQQFKEYIIQFLVVDAMKKNIEQGKTTRRWVLTGSTLID